MRKVSVKSWHRLGAVNPAKLSDARLELHYALQLATSLGKCFLEPRPEDSHGWMTWDERTGSLVSETVQGNSKIRCRLDLRKLTLYLANPDAGRDDNPLSSFPLHEKTFFDAYNWLSGSLNDLGLKGDRLCVDIMSLPEHPIRNGGKFTTDLMKSGLNELALYFSNADSLFKGTRELFSNASEVKCRPQTLDIGITTPLGNRGGDTKKSFHAGLSAGTDEFPEPHFYSYLLPYPPAGSLPPLRFGFRHTDGWTGAFLKASSIVFKEGGESVQARLAAAFINETFEIFSKL